MTKYYFNKNALEFKRKHCRRVHTGKLQSFLDGVVIGIENVTPFFGHLIGEIREEHLGDMICDNDDVSFQNVPIPIICSTDRYRKLDPKWYDLKCRGSF